MPTASPLRDPGVVFAQTSEQSLVRGITFTANARCRERHRLGNLLTTGAMVQALPSAPLVLGAWLAVD